MNDTGLATIEGAPQGIFTERLAFQLDRVPPGQPVRMSLIARTSTDPDDVFDIFSNPVCRVEKRAPYVFDGRMPNTMIVRLVQSAHLFRRIDLSGLVFGLAVPSRDTSVHMTIALEEPLSGDQRRELRNRGVMVGREVFGAVKCETTGGQLAELALADWIGPIQIKRVVLSHSLR